MIPSEMARIHASAMRTGRAWDEDEITTLLSSQGALTVTLPRAFAIGRVTLDEAELLTLAVAPDAQGRGLGRACLARFHTAAFDAGARTIFLEVAETNAPARALYISVGYGIVARRPGYYRGPDGFSADALVLRLNLGP